MLNKQSAFLKDTSRDERDGCFCSGLFAITLYNDKYKLFLIKCSNWWVDNEQITGADIKDLSDLSLLRPEDLDLD